MSPDLLVPDVAALDPAVARRVRLTVSCDDTAGLSSVPDAGACKEVDGQRVQVMHNGVLVEQGGYYGPWMDEIIRCLRGHHEPQEELVYARIIERLSATAVRAPHAIELGAFWSYYLLWLLHELPHSKVLAMEPDPNHLEVGRRNFALNRRSGQFIQGVVGPEPGQLLAFRTESDGRTIEVPQRDLAGLMRLASMDAVDLLLCDVQGGEALFFPQALDLLAAGAVRFAVVSTHHHSISGDPLTHQKLLQLFTDLGAHIVAEHTVGESYSGDGLIAVAFHPCDRDLTVEVSRARQGESLFGGLEHDLAAELARRRAAGDQLAAVERDRAELAARVAAMEATKLWRWSSTPRSAYSRLRARGVRPA